MEKAGGHAMQESSHGRALVSPGTQMGKLSPANLFEGFCVSVVSVPQLSIMHIVDFKEI